MYLTP